MLPFCFRHLLMFLKSSNVHTNTFHASNPNILRDIHPNPSFAPIYEGVGILTYLFPIYSLLPPQRGSLLTARWPGSDFNEMQLATQQLSFGRES